MKNWIKYRLNEICIIGDGNHSSNYPKRDEMVDDGVPFIRGNNMVDGLISWNDMKFIKLEKHLILKKGHLKEGDILFTNRGEIGKIAIVSADFENANLNSQIAWLRCSEKIISKFLFYFLSSPFMRSYYNVEKSGAALQQFTIKKIREIPIFVPPLLEQHRIVSILDHCFGAIDKAKANAEQNLQNAKELFESYLQGVFEKKGEGWEEKTLGALCKFNQGIQRGVELQTEVQKENQVRFLRIVDFTQGNEPPRYIDNPGTKYVLNEDDVSLVRYGASTGFVCRGIHGALANNMFRVIPNNLNELSNDFLYIYLLSPIFKNVIKKSMGGAAMPAISFGLIKNIPFPIPNLKEQERIAYQFELLQAETQNLLSHYQKRIDDLEELKKSILQKAFAGELKTEKMVEEMEEVQL